MNRKEAENRLFIIPEDIWKPLNQLEILNCPHCKKEIILQYEPNVFNPDIFVTYGKNKKELEEIEKLLHDEE